MVGIEKYETTETVMKLNLLFLLHVNSSVVHLDSGKKDMEQLKTYTSRWLLYFVCSVGWEFFMSKHSVTIESTSFFPFKCVNALFQLELVSS